MIQETQSKETNYDNMTFIQKLVYILSVLTNKNNYIYIPIDLDHPLYDPHLHKSQQQLKK